MMAPPDATGRLQAPVGAGPGVPAALAFKAALRASMAQEIASASASVRRPSPWTLQSRRLISTASASVRAAAISSWNFRAGMGLRSETRRLGDGFRQSSTVARQRGACVELDFQGRSGLTRIPDLPPLAGDTGPPLRRVFVFLGVRSFESAANQGAASRKDRRHSGANAKPDLPVWARPRVP